ncbi:unnamed protein product [Amoebophrya sp. A25]|nr:unnamed protein product [Amoebophrya sp. A25]|eukprot:GSA25T00008866001.1
MVSPNGADSTAGGAGVPTAAFLTPRSHGPRSGNLPAAVLGRSTNLRQSKRKGAGKCALLEDVVVDDSRATSAEGVLQVEEEKLNSLQNINITNVSVAAGHIATASSGSEQSTTATDVEQHQEEERKKKISTGNNNNRPRQGELADTRRSSASIQASAFSTTTTSTVVGSGMSQTTLISQTSNGQPIANGRTYYDSQMTTGLTPTASTGADQGSTFNIQGPVPATSTASGGSTGPPPTLLKSGVVPDSAGLVHSHQLAQTGEDSLHGVEGGQFEGDSAAPGVAQRKRGDYAQYILLFPLVVWTWDTWEYAVEIICGKGSLRWQMVIHLLTAIVTVGFVYRWETQSGNWKMRSKFIGFTSILAATSAWVFLEKLVASIAPKVFDQHAINHLFCYAFLMLTTLIVILLYERVNGIDLFQRLQDIC